MAKAHALAASKEIFAQQITKLQSSTNKQALSDEIDSLTTPSGKVRKLSSFLETIVSHPEKKKAKRLTPLTLKLKA